MNNNNNSHCFIIAEAGVNHNGDFDRALKMIDAAKESGADAIKFQTFKSEKLCAVNTPQAKYQTNNIGKKQTQFEMLKRLELPLDQFEKLADYCKEVGIIFLTTPFDEDSADHIDPLVHLYKIPSGELANKLFLTHLAKKNKPIILSTGMANLEEISDAIDTLKENGCKDLTVLHCVTEYPTPYDHVNLFFMETLKKKFQVPIGFSDHTIGIEVPIAAVALGASTIEKHFTLDRTLPGPDHAASLDPDELKQMVTSIRNIAASLGSSEKVIHEAEKENARVIRKKIYSRRDIQKGELVDTGMFATYRSEKGMSVTDFKLLECKKALQDISSGEPILSKFFE